MNPYCDHFDAIFDDTSDFFTGFAEGADVTAAEIVRALGYTPADVQAVEDLRAAVATKADKTEVDDFTMYTNCTRYIRDNLRLHYSHTGGGTYAPNNKRNAIINPICFDYPIKIVTDSEHQFAVQIYDGYITGQAHLIYASGWLTEYDVPSNTYFCLIVKNNNDSDTDISTTNSITVYGTVNVNTIMDIANRLQDQNPIKGFNYYRDCNCRRHTMSCSALGNLSRGQSFAIKNNFYYSTDGRTLCKQDKDFKLINSVEMNLGHGNALQLGADGMLYASGWDDNKIHIVNPDTMTKTGEITLPTTGYTTCAVDTVKQIAYIFQRETNPATYSTYNFIVYDYANAQTVNTIKTAPMAYMQAVDFVKDRIMVTTGAGTVEFPNTYTMYNTSCEIVGDYDINAIKDVETEGVFIDRDTGDIYISDATYKVFKFS